MGTEEQRRERVANGSRRKRDLAATFDPGAYARHFPEELPHRVKVAAEAAFISRRRIQPTPEQVWDALVARGWTKQQIEERHGKGAQ